MVSELTIAFALLCVCVLAYAYRSRRSDMFILGVLSLFTLGYFVLPLSLRHLSALETVDDAVLSAAVFLSLLFFSTVCFGALIGGKAYLRRGQRLQRVSGIDSFLLRHNTTIFVFSIAVYWTYVSTATITIYQAGGVESFVEQWQHSDAILAFAGNVSLAVSALCFVIGASYRSKRATWLWLLIYMLPITALLLTAQRNAVLLPFIYLAVAHAICGQGRTAFRAVAVGAVTIALLSPVLVYFRELSTGDPATSLSGAFGQMQDQGWDSRMFLQSLVDRADVLYNMTIIMEEIDAIGYANAQYFYSIFLKFVPGLLLSSKPIALSSTGDLEGHLSVIAWYVVRDNPSSMGSLTVFGAITAFREGGWAWVPVNGFLAGILYSVIFRFFAQSQLWKRVFYIVASPVLCVQNVPPSFFEILTSLSGLLWVFLAVLIIDLLVRPAPRNVSRQLNPGIRTNHLPPKRDPAAVR